MGQRVERQSFWNSVNREISSGVSVLIKENTELEPIMTKKDEE